VAINKITKLNARNGIKFQCWMSDIASKTSGLNSEQSQIQACACIHVLHREAPKHIKTSEIEPETLNTWCRGKQPLYPNQTLHHRFVEKKIPD
jgi:hypothetical protein